MLLNKLLKNRLFQSFAPPLKIYRPGRLLMLPVRKFRTRSRVENQFLTEVLLFVCVLSKIQTITRHKQVRIFILIPTVAREQ